MSKTSRRSSKRLGNVMLAGVLSGMGVYAHADGFAIEDNKLTITGSGASAGFSQETTVGSDGVVEDIVDVPSTDGVGIPSFSFDLITDALTPGSYDFRVAVTFAREGSTARIEAVIGRLVLHVGGDSTVTGTIPAKLADNTTNNTLNVIARGSIGTVILDPITNISTNGPVTLSGSSVTFDASNVITRIRNKNSIFNDTILEEFEDESSYDYRIIVQQLAGPETVQFSTVAAGPVYSALPKVQTGACAAPCAQSTAALVLNTNQFASSFTDAYSVTGSFNIVPSVAASPSPSASPAAADPDPGVTLPSPAPSPFDPEEDFDLDDLLGDLEDLLGELEFDEDTPPSEEQIALLDAAFGNLAEQLSNAGDLNVDQGFNLLASAGQTFVKGGDASELGGQINVGAAADTLGGFANVINGMISNSGGVPLSTDQLNTLTTFTEDKLSSAANMLSNTTSKDDVERMMESTADLLNKTLEAGADLSPELIASAVQIALKAVSNITGDVVGKLGLGEVFPEGFDVNNQSQVQELMRTQPSLLSETIKNTPAISAPGVNQNAALGNLAEAEGINLESAQRIVAALGSITNPSNVALPGGQTATGKLLSALNRAFGGGTVNAVLAGGLNLQSATSFAVDVDAVTGALRVRADSESYAATSTAVRLVPTSIPEGISYLADGRAVAVADGVAIELAPAAADLLGFAAATERAGFPASFRNDGSVSLNLGNNQRFAGTFAYDNIGGSTGNCGAITFTNPTGAVNAASYAFTVRCANGITQRIVPFIDNTAFYTTVANAGLTVRTDRNTGAITIGNVGRFKPSFFVTPLTTADQTFLTQVGTNGFAFRSRDLNADGRADYEVITATGVQAMYAMP